MLAPTKKTLRPKKGEWFSFVAELRGIYFHQESNASLSHAMFVVRERLEFFEKNLPHDMLENCDFSFTYNPKDKQKSLQGRLTFCVKKDNTISSDVLRKLLTLYSGGDNGVQYFEITRKNTEGIPVTYQFIGLTPKGDRIVLTS
jgi:hypothetical protein